MTGAGIAVDKAQLLKGEPTAIVQKSGDELLRSLAAKLGLPEGTPISFIDSTATEEPVGQIPEGEAEKP